MFVMMDFSVYLQLILIVNFSINYYLEFQQRITGNMHQSSIFYRTSSDAESPERHQQCKDGKIQK